MRYTHTTTRLLMSGIAAMVAAIAGCSQTPALDVAAPTGGATGLGGASSTVEASGDPELISRIPAITCSSIPSNSRTLLVADCAMCISTASDTFH